MEKNLRLQPHQIVRLIPAMGNCVATDKITVDGEPVGYMYRVQPADASDSGWRFLSGTEDQAYVDYVGNLGTYDVNTIANYDPMIIPYLNRPVGTKCRRLGNTPHFEII